MYALRKRAVQVLGVAWIAVLSLTLAQRAGGEPISYSLILCEDLSVLQNPDNPMIADSAAHVSQHTLMVRRTMPYAELRNTSDQGSITQFRMTIGNTDNHFDWGKLIEASPGVTFSLEGLDGGFGGLTTNELIINFTGFDPGDFVRFRTGLDSDNPNASSLVDYRQTLFHVNGMDLPGDNATVQVSFSTSSGDTTLIKQLPDFEGPRPTATSMAFSFGCGRDGIVPFILTDEGPLPGPVIPEPGTAALAGLGLVGLVGILLRRRRR